MGLYKAIDFNRLKGKPGGTIGINSRGDYFDHVQTVGWFFSI